MRWFAVLAIVTGCAEPAAVQGGDDGAGDGKEDSAGATLCDSLATASKRLCKLIPNNGWRTALADELTKPYFEPLAKAVADERDLDASTTSIDANIYPAEENTFAALRYVSPGRVKAVIVGQDPYIGEGQAIGLSFAVAPGIAVPPSLNNIYAELVREAGDATLSQYLPDGFVCPADGDLTPWAKRGVFLLNSILTVRHGIAGSNADFGWQNLTDAILAVARDRNAGEPTVYLLWGAYARAKKELIVSEGPNPNNPNVLVLESNHPSPLSSGFVGNNHFATANQFFNDHGASEIEWALPPPAPGVVTAHKCTEL